MSDIRVEPGDRPPERRETITFGTARRPPFAARLRALPGVRRYAGRPLPRIAVAALAALAGGIVVAMYMERPVEMVMPGPVATVAIIEPEGWLHTHPVPDHNPVPEQGPTAPLWQQAIEQHPSQAAMVLPLPPHGERRLHGLPPGRYQVQVSCDASALELPVELIHFAVGVNPAAGDEVSTVERPCDGALHSLDDALAVAEHRAFRSHYFASDLTTAQGQVSGEPLGRQVVVVVSFTPVS